MIEVDGLVKRFGPRTAVDGIRFTVPPGTITGLVGPNGAGKSTTIRIIVGIALPSAGTVRVAGHDVVREPIAAKQVLGYVPDEPTLFDDLTAEEHLQFAGRAWQVADAAERAPALLAELGLADRARAFPGELSRGMKQKLAIAMALLHRPAALVLDEPLTGLDPRAMRQMRETIRRQADAGTAVLLSSHQLPLVEQLCDRVVVLASGRIVAEGTLEALAADAAAAGDQSLEELILRVTADAA